MAVVGGVRRLARTSVFRIGFLYLFLFTVSSALLMMFVGWIAFSALDRQTRATIETDAKSLVSIFQRRGLERLARIITVRGERDRFNLYLLVGPNDKILAGNLSTWPRFKKPKADQAEANWVEFRYGRVGPRGPEERLAFARVIALNPALKLLVGRDVNDRRVVESQLLRTGFFSFALVVVLGLAVGLVMARRTAAQVEAINRTLNEIMAGDLSKRIPTRGGQDELSRLSQSLNLMLDRIEALMGSLREVSENIAHDLKSPLNRLRSDLDISLARARDPKADQDTLERAVEEVAGLVGTFEALLAIARAESGGSGLEKTKVSLKTLVEDAADLYEALSEERSIRLNRSIDGDGMVMGHRGSLMQAFANILDNAIKFSPQGGVIELALREQDGAVVVTVSDQGPGIPEKDRERVQDRFVRLDASRNAPGSGLGLSLVRAVARMHGGTLTLEEVSVGKTDQNQISEAQTGLSVRFSLPAEL